MKSLKNVSRKEIIDSLQKSYKKNCLALDYIRNEIARKDDIYKYKEDDSTLEELNNLKYIAFTLEFVGNSYLESLKKAGVLNAKGLFNWK